MYVSYETGLDCPMEGEYSIVLKTKTGCKTRLRGLFRRDAEQTFTCLKAADCIEYLKLYKSRHLLRRWKNDSSVGQRCHAY